MSNQVAITTRINTVTIKRPNGEIEVVDVTARFPILTPTEYSRMQQANKAAGRGEVISCERRRVVTGYRPMTEIEECCAHQDMMERTMRIQG